MLFTMGTHSILFLLCAHRATFSDLIPPGVSRGAGETCSEDQDYIYQHTRENWPLSLFSTHQSLPGATLSSMCSYWKRKEGAFRWGRNAHPVIRSTMGIQPVSEKTKEEQEVSSHI